MIKALLTLLLLLPSVAHAAAVDQLNQSDPHFVTVLNDDLQRLNGQLININTGYPASKITGLLATSSGGTSSNLSACVQGSIPYFNATGKMAGCVGPGTSGQIVISQGSSANPTFGNLIWSPNNIQVFTTSGTWAKPAGVSTVYVKAWGPGGGGGARNGPNSGGGGGAGGYSEGMITVTGNVTVTVGTGAIGGVGNGVGGSTGSDTTFAGSTTLTASAGVGGTGGGPGGAGGTASNGSINLSGNSGVDGSGSSGGQGGQGGQAEFGGTGGAGGVNMVGQVGQKPGGGGGGGGPSGNGGNGADGLVIVYY